MRLLLVFLFILPCVFSADFQTDLNASTYQQLKKLQKLTDQLEKEGIYYTPNPDTLKVDKDDLFLNIYTQSNPNGTEISIINASDVIQLTSFSLELKTVIYIHGWLDDVDKESSVLIRDSLLNAIIDLNIIIMNWDKCATSINYLASWGCVEGTGNYLGEFLTSLTETYGYSPSDITLVGHSLGAHIAGYAGKYTNGTLGVIVGLDPAGPLYFESLKNKRLNSDDAQFVQAIHTDAHFLGVSFNVGKVDFWPNGGYSQVGCGFQVTGKCSHLRAFRYYAESVTLNDFVGVKCDSYKNFQAGKCDENSKSRMGGLDIDTSPEGEYYLATNEESPYGTTNL